MGNKRIVTWLLWFCFFSIVILNFLNLFVPETGFDALWYHLTLPKLWLLKKQWHFDGGLLYYSVMPRLTETIFIPLIKYTGAFGPKLLQFLSGLGIALIIGKFAQKLKFTGLQSIVAVTLYYCTWLVSWESSSAYIDLFRSLLETIALYQIIFGSKKIGSFFLGLALGTKWLALGSLVIYSLVFGSSVLPLALLVASPWFLISFYYTGNPVFPLFSGVMPHSFQPIIEILKHLSFPWYYLTFPFDDFLSPIISIIFIISVFGLFSKIKEVKQFSLVGVLGIFSTFFLDPPSARFTLPYLPAIIISAVYLVSKSKKSWNIFVILVLLSSVAVFSLRFVASIKNIPFLLGRETKNQYLEKLSPRLSESFLDTDNYFRDNLSSNDKILIDKLHNLYYFPYNFDHTSWSRSVDNYDYLVTKGDDPSKINGELIHTNSVGIQLFKLTR